MVKTTVMASVLPELRFSDVVVALLLVLLGGPFYYAILTLFVKWLRIQRTRRIFEAQGVKCLPRPFLRGNLPELAAINAKTLAQPMPQISHAIGPRLVPQLYLWSKAYVQAGEHFTYWFGFQARYVLEGPEQAKELLSNKSGHFKKPFVRPDTKEMFGDGLGLLDGEKWARHRRIINPAFFIEKLKAMTSIMGGLTVEMIKKWGCRVEGKQQAIDVAEEFRNLTADIISHTAFGSSFAEGKLAFELQHKQQELFSKLSTTLYIPGSRFFPTARNRYRSSLKYRIHDVLGQIIQKRMELGEVRGDGYGNDLLGLMLAANKGELHGNQKNLSMGLDELIDECKTFFFAGHETISTLLTFMFLLLANHPEWQERLREEVFEVCGKTELPTAESLNHMKLVGMVLNETLRLYPPVPAIFRETDNDMKVGKVLVPAGTHISVPIIKWHTEEGYWGPNAEEFHPERFEEGILKACKVPGAYLPFSFGPRNCIGQVFANMVAKMVLATILQQYRFHLSPQYVHAPINVLILRPQFGMPIIFETLQ